MPNEKAQKIIRDAMTDPEIYAEMAKRESEVWSNFFASPEKEELRKKELAANQELAPGKQQLQLAQTLRELGLHPRRGLSLGCGSGRAERTLMKQGICDSFHGIDIAPDAIAEARKVAGEMTLNCTYETQDLNFVSLPENEFDLVVAQTSLHHVLHLEHVIGEIVKCLKPDGLLWVHDYIGESQFQFSDDRLKIMNDLLALLPKRLTFNHFAGRHVDKVARREPGKLVSPFESIRSGEIKPLLMEKFEIVKMREDMTFLDRVAGLGMRQNFVETEDTRAIFAILRYFDRLLAERNVVPPVLGQYLLRPKPGGR